MGEVGARIWTWTEEKERERVENMNQWEMVTSKRKILVFAQVTERGEILNQ